MCFRHYLNLAFGALFAIAVLGCENFEEIYDEVYVEDLAEKNNSTSPRNLPPKADGFMDEALPENQESWSWDEIISRCKPPDLNEPYLAQTHFSWNQSFQEMEDLYQELYEAPNRLFGRAFWDESLEEFVVPYGDEYAILSRRMIENLRAHIEKALFLEYVDHVFFSDMGHSHFFIPLDTWDEVYAKLPVMIDANRYTIFFDDPTLKFLYHTAEQLDLLDETGKVHADKRTQWRYYTRNLVGDNDGKGVLDIAHNFDRPANTVGKLEGHRYFGAGFFFSANRNGCFPFRHEDKIEFFDFSLTWLPMSDS